MIAAEKVVTMNYLLTNAEGEILDRSTEADPFIYLHGGSQILPNLEAELEGLAVGDKKTVTLTPEKGYGEVDPKLRLSVQRSMFPKDVELKEGMQFSAPTDEGDVIFTIQSVQGENIMIDGNHPLAGQTLTFKIEVVAVRDATKEELEHGHAHGEDGHHHH